MRTRAKHRPGPHSNSHRRPASVAGVFNIEPSLGIGVKTTLLSPPHLRRITARWRAAVVEGYESGKTSRQVAAEFGLGRTTVLKILKAAVRLGGASTRDCLVGFVPWAGFTVEQFRGALIHPRGVCAFRSLDTDIIGVLIDQQNLQTVLASLFGVTAAQLPERGPLHLPHPRSCSNTKMGMPR